MKLSYKASGILGFCMLLLLLAGCQSVLERSFHTYEPHSEPTGQEDTSYVPQISDYASLREAILATVNDGAAERTVRLYDYNGDVETDVQNALKDVMNSNPIGAYAVNSIAYQQTQILTYYEIRFDITYRRTRAQVAAVKTVYGVADFEKYLLEGMLNFQEQLAFQIQNYSPEIYDAAATYERLYYKTPMAAYGAKSIAYTLYPDSGTRRIMEINISYSEPGYSLKSKARRSQQAAKDFVKTMDPDLNELQRALVIHDFVCESAQYDEETAKAAEAGGEDFEKTDAFTAYGALVGGKAVCEGYALAYKQLCDEAGIECIVVTGRLQSVPHLWNMIHLPEGWFHVDCTNDDVDGKSPLRQFFAVNDDTMSATHTWDALKYPLSGQPEPKDLQLPGTEGGTTGGVDESKADVNVETPSAAGTVAPQGAVLHPSRPSLLALGS